MTSSASLTRPWATRLRKLELARTDCLHHLATAHAEDYREMLRRALEALDRDIERLSRS